MKRHQTLVPLSHDHHHTLVQARRARRAADADAAGRRRAGAELVRFFEAESVGHFREEEEQVFPLLVEEDADPPNLVVQALAEHCRLHAGIARLRQELEHGDVAPETLRRLGEQLDGHVRLEERELFPLLEQLPEERLATLDLGRAPEDRTEVVDLTAPGGSGPLWGTATDDLNATLLAWEPGRGTPEHTNRERDVLLVVLDGSGTVVVDGREHALVAGSAVVLRKGQRRRIDAGPGGIRYLTVHLRRPPLQIARAGGG